ncbi:hypothetical protein GOODEAATRI_014899 [Goodea atripinnis]|uniref:Globin domain-containing protein n=1 Tax=Goodea atripinnis TaxID=208336 RepID=A0ABV0MS45_9TELE
MVEWTDDERNAISTLWSNLDALAECISVVVAAKFGPSVFTPGFQEAWQKFLAVVVSALGRQALIVYPWIERYFGTFGDTFTTTAILNNPKLAALGKIVLAALDTAVKDMDNVKGAYASLSRVHYEKIKVDPEHFRVSD